MNWGAVVDNLATAAGAIGAILSVILAGKLFGPGKRQSEAETRGTDATSTKVMSEAAILWHSRFEQQATYVDAMEATIDAWWDWRRSVQIIIDAACPSVKLPPPPAAPKRPPRTT